MLKTPSDIERETDLVFYGHFDLSTNIITNLDATSYELAPALSALYETHPIQMLKLFIQLVNWDIDYTNDDLFPAQIRAAIQSTPHLVIAIPQYAINTYDDKTPIADEMDLFSLPETIFRVAATPQDAIRQVIEQRSNTTRERTRHRTTATTAPNGYRLH